MKALKNSPEWVKFSKPKKDIEGREIPIEPYSRLTSLCIHTRGYTKEGKFVEGKYGHGKETLYLNLGRNAKDDSNGFAKLLHDNFIISPKMREEIDII